MKLVIIYHPNPSSAAERTSKFLNEEFDIKAMTFIVNPALYRNKV
jgi:hypothetical protein